LLRTPPLGTAFLSGCDAAPLPPLMAWELSP